MTEYPSLDSSEIYTLLDMHLNKCSNSCYVGNRDDDCDSRETERVHLKKVILLSTIRLENLREGKVDE